jgi:glycyl-tRNA synthetase beta subunit
VSARELLFEIGVEELPAGYAPPALEQLERGVRAGLEELRLSFGGVVTHGTPRRLAVIVHRLAERQTDFDEEAMGPATRVAFDADGHPTRALLGFCAGKGVEPSAVRKVSTPKGEYVAVTVHHKGKPAHEVLPAMLGQVAMKLQFPEVDALGRGRLSLRPPRALARGAARQGRSCRCRRSGSMPAAARTAIASCTRRRSR